MYGSIWYVTYVSYVTYQYSRLDYSHLFFIFLISLLAIYNDILEQLLSFGNSFSFSSQGAWSILRTVPSWLDLDLTLNYQIVFLKIFMVLLPRFGFEFELYSLLRVQLQVQQVDQGLENSLVLRPHWVLVRMNSNLIFSVLVQPDLSLMAFLFQFQNRLWKVQSTFMVFQLRRTVMAPKYSQQASKYHFSLFLFRPISSLSEPSPLRSSCSRAESASDIFQCF